MKLRNRIKAAIKNHGYGEVRFTYDENHFKVTFTREQEEKLCS
jgi:hypothetical protein